LERCETCHVRSLPSPADYEGMSIPALPAEVSCPNCGTRYRLRKTVLAAQRVDHRSFWAWVTPNMGAIILTLGLGLIILFPLWLLWRGLTWLLSRVIRISIYKRLS